MDIKTALALDYLELEPEDILQEGDYIQFWDEITSIVKGSVYIGEKVKTLPINFSNHSSRRAFRKQ